MLKNTISINKGFSMVEVLVTLLIILVGLLGIAALQIRAQMSELEAYQRAQALIIMSDIIDKINIHRTTVGCFAITTNTTTGTPYIGAPGAGHIGTPSCTLSTAAYNTQTVNTLTMLDAQLNGAAEQLAGADIVNVGAMTGARACVTYDPTTVVNGVPGTGIYTIIVTWQGMAELVAPSNMNCAVGLYGNEASRRAVAATVRIANMF